jgi:enolase
MGFREGQPSGASTGEQKQWYLTVERLSRKGVLNAVKNVNTIGC